MIGGTLEALPATASAGAPTGRFLDASPTFSAPDKNVEGGLLIRELARQTVLLTARDELGLATRDAVLGEFDPRQEPDGLHITTRAYTGKNLEITLERGPTGKRQVVSRKTVPLADPVDYAALVTALGKLT